MTNNPATYRDPSGHAGTDTLDLSFGPPKQAGQSEVGGYCDFNVTIALWVGATGGVINDFEAGGLRFYLGGAVSPLSSVSYTCSASEVSQGFPYVGFQGFLPSVVPIGGQVGWDPESDVYYEEGIGMPGGSISVFGVGPAVTPDDILEFFVDLWQ